MGTTAEEVLQFQYQPSTLYVHIHPASKMGASQSIAPADTVASRLAARITNLDIEDQAPHQNLEKEYYVVEDKEYEAGTEIEGPLQLSYPY